MKEMKKIGRDVCFLHADDQRPRMGEGAFIRLKTGAIMFGYSEFCGETYRDHAYARIAAIFSYDEGETWGDHRVLLQINPSNQELNIMSVNLVRGANDEILLFHGKKFKKDGHVYTTPHVNVSYDEGKTWTPDRRCILLDHYYVMNNDRVTKLKNGRLLIPLAKYESLEEVKVQDKRAIQIAISDDNGQSWRFASQSFTMPFDNVYGYEEPGLYEHEDGTLWCYFRTNIGCQFEIVSRDGGETWSEPKPNVFFSSARSPMQVRKLCGRFTVAIFNPIMSYTGRKPSEVWGRTPYVLAVSENDGATHDKESFDRLFYLEDDRTNSYCYPATFDGGDYFLAAYYHSDGTNWALRSLKMKKIGIEELQSEN